ncbi:MAG: glycosyltransferase family 4 protein [Chloroflexi bacterium]|nr:glycosyltransferase family 4 protein [Chloroflexota bacterium]
MKIGVFVGEEGNWTFLREIYDDLVARYPVEVFKKREYDVPLFYGRLNRWAHTDGIGSVLRRNDVSYFEWASELLVPASQLPKRHKIVTRLHSYEIYAWAPKVNWDHVDGVILVSQAMKRKFVALYPAQAHKVTVVYYGKPLDTFGYTQREFDFSLGMLCGIHPIKRIYEVILAAHALRGRGYQPHLHIGGGRIHGPPSDEYFFAVHRLVEMLKLEDAVTFHGHVTNPAQWLKGIDVFISNSYWEGQQNALLEAMATGCYCLSHNWDGADEVVPEENLYIANGELCDKIVRYAEMPAVERERQRAKTRAIAEEKFDIRNTCAGIRTMLEAVAQGG